MLNNNLHTETGIGHFTAQPVKVRLRLISCFSAEILHVQVSINYKVNEEKQFAW